MRNRGSKMRIGILGCGAIGSGIAQSVPNQLKHHYQLTALHDIEHLKAKNLEKKLHCRGLVKSSLSELITHCDLMVEAVNASTTKPMIQEALKAKRHVLSMSVGKLLNSQGLLNLAQSLQVCLLIPSGAIAGVDALKAASLSAIQHITLTTRKPPLSFLHTPFVQKKKIHLSAIKSDTVLFEGDVASAVQLFPQNINVAVTLALSCHHPEIITVRIIASPGIKNNIHEIEIIGDFGRIMTRTDNTVCPDNPKTSYLAVLSGIQTLKQFAEYVKIGT